MTPANIFLRNQLPVLDVNGNHNGYRREFAVEDYRITVGCVWFRYGGKSYYVPLENIDGVICK